MEPQATGVLLLNLGTPDEPTAPAIRRYLASFLTDRRVVDLPAILWRPFLYGVILPLRSRRLVPKYELIWTNGDSPIRTYGQSLARQVESELDGYEPRVKPIVRVAMTYGNPSIDAALDEFEAHSISELLVLPLFPQYSSAATAATFDQLARCLRRRINLPQLRFVRDYHDRSEYLRAMTRSLEPYAARFKQGTRLIFSYHGIPMAQVQAGDPYPLQCLKTAELIAQHLALPEDAWQVTYQSRFGAARWLMPATDQVLKDLPQQGNPKVVVVCPGFSSDCLETLEEINVENRRVFTAAGGTHFDYVPALNDSPDHVRMITAILQKLLSL